MNEFATAKRVTAVRDRVKKLSLTNSFLANWDAIGCLT